ncbi:hypothetical protein D7Z54_14425 [Salibacterium salarium]|uniref:Uncharacterized protein n=1 Tax=Salibacterium salarium TaxID=284579 RepID=A0A428N2H7_9BACI|nr:hypothetical protein [Salibacterium salarium]RSL32643.1 hypothetical protein D7Z54_14425 [Salibacterium salarium]
MTISEYSRWKQRLYEILKIEEPTRTYRLVNFMTDMEQACGIPARHDAEFEKNYPMIMDLYRKANDERTI